MDEKTVKISAKLYDCRNTAKKFFADEYFNVIEPFVTLIKQVMKANNLGVIPALLKISKTNSFTDSDMAQMLFMAATVELVENPQLNIKVL